MTTQSFEEIGTSYGVDHPTELTPEQIDQFNTQGFLPVKDAFDAEKALRIQDKVWEVMAARNEVFRDKPETWDRPWRGIKEDKKRNWANDLSPDRLCRAFDDLLGPDGWEHPRIWGTFLRGVPEEKTGAWYIDRGGWHWDGRPDFEPLPGVGAFTIYNELPSHAGGTMLVAGSHRLVCRFFDDLAPDKKSRPTKIQKKYFRSRFDWFKELQNRNGDDYTEVTEKYMNQGVESEGVPLKVVEVTGHPGDAVLFHPWIVHSRPLMYGTQPRFLRIGGVARK